MIKVVKIDSLTLDPNNAMGHPEDNIAAIAASLRRFGQQEPVLVDTAGKILAGNGTVLAAISLRWKKIGITRSELTGHDAVGYAIDDNQTARLSEWDQVPLATTLRSLQSEGFDVNDIGFTPDQVDQLVLSLADTALSMGGANLDDQRDVEAPEFRRALKYELAFETIEQMDHWFGFLDWTRRFAEYDAPTIAGRIDRFLTDQGFSDS
jgi:ParB-like chromosome segregation protein Spo0J